MRINGISNEIVGQINLVNKSCSAPQRLSLMCRQIYQEADQLPGYVIVSLLCAKAAAAVNDVMRDEVPVI